jgi:hypothetical protein
VTTGEVASVLHLLNSAGFTEPSFVGSYDPVTTDYAGELER